MKYVIIKSKILYKDESIEERGVEERLADTLEMSDINLFKALNE